MIRPAGLWSPTGSLATARYAHTATLLPNGKVLVAGGFNVSGYLSSAELYDPASGTLESHRQPRHRTLVVTRRRCCPMARCWSPEEVAAMILEQRGAV